MEKQLCGKCSEFKELKYFPMSADKTHRKRTCYSCLGKKERALLKYDMLKAFGFECQCCGEDHPYFLTLDHIENDGNIHRDELKYNEQQIYRLARREGWPKDKYQLLCMNCNFAKGHFKECPHKLGITSEEALKNLESLSKGIGRDLVQVNKVGLSLGPLAKILRASGLSEEVIKQMLEQAKEAKA